MSGNFVPRHQTRLVRIAGIPVGGGAPVVVQSMTNTDTADASATAQQVRALAEAGSELVRITVNSAEAAAAVPQIRNILERRPVADEADRNIRFGAFRYDPGRGELFRGEQPVHLTAAEAGLLASLAARAGDPVSREDLSQAAQFSGNIRNVDVQMTRLRRKIEPDPRFPRYLQTVRGTGYALKPE